MSENRCLTENMVRARCLRGCEMDRRDGPSSGDIGALGHLAEGAGVATTQVVGDEVIVAVVAAIGGFVCIG